MKYDYDIAVVGAGSGGLTVAFGLATAGKKVVLVEKGLIGGDCTNYGCVPSKALIDIAKYSPDLGFRKAMQEVRKRRKIIQDEETVEKIESHRLKVLQGTASFIDDHRLHIQNGDNPPSSDHNSGPLNKGEYGVREITAKKIILSTGSRAQNMEIEGANLKDIFTNHEIFEQVEDIKKLIIVGGGYIGCELAESIATLGVEVHIIQRNMRLIPKEEEASSKLLKEIFESKGIHIHTGSHIKSSKDNVLTITDLHGKKEQNIVYDKLLIAAGRQANIEKLDLEKAGIKSDKKGVLVDSYNRTNKKHIFAIGDCVSENPQFTHWANNEGRGLIRNILIPFPKTSVRKAVLPTVLYTHQEIARVGKTRYELKKRYDEEEFVTHTLYFSHNDRSRVTDDTTGFIMIHFKRLSGKILGATMYGSNAGELIAQITHAMEHKLSAYKLAKTIQAYPTKSDLLKRVCDMFVVKTLKNIKNELLYYVKDNIIQIITAVIWIGIIIGFISYRKTTGFSLEQIGLNFYNFVSGNPIGGLIYICAYAIRPIILFPATVMTFMSGALFGFWGGFFFTLIGETMSAIFAYFLGNIFGKKLLTGDEAGIIGKLKYQLNKDPFTSILMTRLLFFPFDLTNYTCGFLRVKFWHFVGATAIGIIPGMSVFILAGAAFHNEKLTSFSDAIKDIDTSMLLYAACLFIITLSVARFLKKIKK